MKLLLLFLISFCCFLTLNAKTTWKPGTRIVNGYKGTAEKFPYQVALEVDSENDTVNMCGGSLVGSKQILTAAHCFDGIYTGSASFGSDKYMQGTRQKFSRVSLHEKYEFNGTTVVNDIAIIHLDTPVATNGKTISIISLDYGNLPIGQNITISGFGLIGDDKVSDQLFYAQEKVISNKECDGFLLLPGVFCSQGYNKQQTCVGDSGGPAVKYDKSGKAIQIGVLSFGADSCEKGDPDIFTRVADFQDWIKKHWD